MKRHYKIQTIFDTHTCTALRMKLFYPLSTAVNVLPSHLLPCCTFYSTSDISYLTSALITQVAAHKVTQITAERNRINTHCTIYVSRSSHALYRKTGHKFFTNFHPHGLDDPWFSQQRQDMFLSSKTSRTALVPNQLLLNEYHKLLALKYNRGSIKLITRLHLTPRWMSRAIHLLLLLAFTVWTT